MISVEDVRNAFPELAPLTLIASSGQKHVFQAGAARDRVLKILKTSDTSNDRAAREVEAVGRLRSQYIPELLQVGERSIGGAPAVYFIEKFVRGETYRQLLNRGPQGRGETLAIADVLLAACRDFEVANLVHRDIKPENIIIGDDGKPWILDFGIVRILDLDSLTKTSDRFGPFTPGYGAPEQIRNQKDTIDSRADIFSVGVVMHEALLGYNPYVQGKRDALAIIKHMLDEDLARLDVNVAGSHQLADFISALTGRYPSRRPDTAANALEWFREVRGIS
jgi:eukaryotic-like serine/threonine-protein kinase